MSRELAVLREQAEGPIASYLGLARKPRALGLDDGMIIPPDEYPLGTAEAVIRAGAMERAPLRGTVRVIVVLVDFSDQPIAADVGHFRDLFFSAGVVPTGSVKEYYQEVTNGLVDITGDVVGVYRMPQTLAWYANGNFGIGRPTGTTRARELARDAALAADPAVNFGPYDNDGNGFVDAFVVVHAGAGGEVTGNPGHIWSHKWNLPAVHATDATKIFGYLTIPEDARLGVCAHELGHLLFGLPDLYDVDDTSEGVGNWCLMGGGSWNGGGDTPAHPSAWCKVNQGWASCTAITTNQNVSIPDVKASHNVLRLWQNGAGGGEYFLVENRQRTGYDAALPGDGLLIWHVDDGQANNTDENHYKVGLVQADGKRDLELKRNRGDAGDPFPGAPGNTSFSRTSIPNSKSYAGADTSVSVTGISASAATMTANVAVRPGKSILKEFKDQRKEHKDTIKDLVKDFKERPKELKEPLKDRKEFKEFKEPVKELKERKEIFETPAEQPTGDLGTTLAELAARVAALEGALAGAPAEPFIGAELRPDLLGGPVYEQSSEPLAARMEAGDRAAKREYDTAPRP